jgi:hypothetical protein
MTKDQICLERPPLKFLFFQHLLNSMRSCPKSAFLLEAGVRDVLEAEHFGPESGQMKGQNTEVSGAMAFGSEVVVCEIKDK